ncbi:MAG: peptide chain release factor N(5)-glutamine methyltransferase [Gemmatimonadales bacterium]
MPEAPRSVGDLVESSTLVLARAGLVDARREALRVWAGVERGRIADAIVGRDEQVAATRSERFDTAIRRRAAGEPLAYVTGSTGFRRLMLRCDRRALIPRPETEGLVEAALARVRTGVAADIGTGSGAIALALRDEGDFDQVLAMDVSADAVALAAENAAVTGLAIDLRQGELTAPLAGQRVNLLVSNPPYLTQAEYDTLDRSVRDYEPELSLVGGPDGQLLIRRLFQEGLAAVAPMGWIAMEVDCNRAADSGRIATGLGWQETTVLNDLFGRARYVLARRGSGG